MIINTKTGIKVSGTLICTPELRQVGSRMVLKMCVRYGTEPPSEPGGQRVGKLLDVDVWKGAEKLDGMFEKGDFITAYGDEIKEHPYNGKIYHSIKAIGIVPDALVTFRWMQQLVDMIPPAAAVPAGAFSSTSEPTPFDAQNAPQAAPQPAQTTLYEAARSSAPDIAGGELYPGESLADYAPCRAAPPSDPLGEAPIQADVDDLPF